MGNEDNEDENEDDALILVLIIRKVVVLLSSFPWQRLPRDPAHGNWGRRNANVICLARLTASFSINVPGMQSKWWTRIPSFLLRRFDPTDYMVAGAEG
jgi:hypothetical protein